MSIAYNESAWIHSTWVRADLFWKRNFENCGCLYRIESHFAGITRLPAWIARTKKSLTPHWHTYSESWVRENSMGTVTVWKNSFLADTTVPPQKKIFKLFLLFFKKVLNFCHFPCSSGKKLLVSCARNLDATDLKHGSFESLYHKLFRGKS